jgi:indole-3-glycerol phosphate synthase
MILDTIAQATRVRVDQAKERLPLPKLQEMLYEENKLKAFGGRGAFAFEQALQKDRERDKKGEMSFICEVKKASPSKGVIAGEFPYLSIAKDYEMAGASAISVLTEPDFFQGSNTYLREISKEVTIPVLRKDFTIDEYQIYEARLIGADAVLLICSLLEEETIKEYLELCGKLGLSALVEAHNETEVRSALRAGARIIGVNNRNLQTFEVDLSNSIRLSELIPDDIIYVAESGIRTNQDIRALTEAGVDAVLIGETLMRSEDKKQQLDALRQ